MGYHIILHCTAIIKPEYLDCIKMEYFDYSGYGRWDEEFEGFPEQWIEFYRIWQELCIYHSFYQFKLEGDQFTFEISIKPHRYVCRSTDDDLTSAYRIMMRDIIAPMSSVILRCEIEHDDYGIGSYYYTDEEVRHFYTPHDILFTSSGAQ
jgi:hypothetical protein